MLVAAVLRPEEREDRELEVVRIALEQRPDSLELLVGEPECAMERRFRHAAQGASVTAGPDHSPRVASLGALVLAADPAARCDVGRVVPLHQARDRRHPARRDDGAAGAHRRAPPARLRRGADGQRAGLRGAARRLETVLRPRRHQCGAADGTRRLGRDAHRLEHRRIAQSTVPIFTFLLARGFLPHEPVGGVRIVGVALGFLGVAALAGFDAGSSWWAIAGTLAVVLSSLSYAGGGSTDSEVTPSQARCSPREHAGRGVVFLPLAIVDPPTQVPGAEASGARRADPHPDLPGQLLALPRPGAVRQCKLSIVTYLMPRSQSLRRGLPRRGGDGGHDRRFRAHPGRRALASGQRLFGYGSQETPAERHDPPRAARRRGFLVALVTHDDVEPFLSVSGRGRRSDAAEVERSEAEPEAFGSSSSRSTATGQDDAFKLANERSRIADLGGLAVHPVFRGRKVADKAARLFRSTSSRARLPPAADGDLRSTSGRCATPSVRVHARRRTSEGVVAKREWVDGVLYGLLADELS